VYEFLNWQVRDVMSTPVTVPPEMSIQDAEKLLESEGFNTLPVVTRTGALLGVVSSIDLLSAFRFNDDESILPQYSEVMKRPVSSVMSVDPQTVRPRTPLTRVLEKLAASRNKSFPVVDEGRVVGVVAREDVMRALRQAEEGKSPGVMVEE